MIDETMLLMLKDWFENYVQTFDSPDENVQRNIALKKEHTKNVCIEILDIAQSLGLDREDSYRAETVALLHDIGRFDQYWRYATFMDEKSENHATLGARILKEKGILKGIDSHDREMILHVVGFHNCAALPDSKNEKSTFFLKLLRDADKIDIWRVVTEHYVQAEELRNSSIDLGLDKSSEITCAVAADLMAGRIANTNDMKTLNDFKLLQMGWIFDINFARTFEIIKKRKYLEKIRTVLPDSDIVRQVYRTARKYLLCKCSAGRCEMAGAI